MSNVLCTVGVFIVMSFLFSVVVGTFLSGTDVREDDR